LKGPWVVAQTWHDLLFAHWPVAGEALRPHVPATLPIDTFDGHAWIGLVPFRMSGVRPRLVPPLPWLSAFAELNVRTYVSRGGKPGVFFFSLDAGNPLAVAAGRRLLHLPYYRARIALSRDGDEVRFSSRRTHAGAPAAEFAARYAPAGDVRPAAPDSLEHFLTERYCLYAVEERGNVSRLEIEHPPWPLQPAEAEVAANTMTRPLGLILPGTPLLHFARRVDVVAWRPRLVPSREP
jgi:uncharacterized protein